MSHPSLPAQRVILFGSVSILVLTHTCFADDIDLPGVYDFVSHIVQVDNQAIPKVTVTWQDLPDQKSLYQITPSTGEVKLSRNNIRSAAQWLWADPEIRAALAAREMKRFEDLELLMANASLCTAIGRLYAVNRAAHLTRTFTTGGEWGGAFGWVYWAIEPVSRCYKAASLHSERTAGLGKWLASEYVRARLQGEVFEFNANIPQNQRFIQGLRGPKRDLYLRKIRDPATSFVELYRGLAPTDDPVKEP